MPLTPAIRDLSQAQSQLVRRDQLLGAGMTRSGITAQLRARRWQAVGPRVVALHNGPLTRDQQEWAAVLTLRAPGALAGRTAAARDGLTGWPASEIEVVVAKGQRPPTINGIHVLVHESRRLSALDIHPVRQPRRTRLPRSLIDAAAWMSAPRAACGLLCSAVQQRLVMAGMLRVELALAGPVKHQRILAATLDDIEGGAQALSEIDVVRLVRKYRLPVTVERQVVRLHRGKRRYIDATLTAPSGRRVHLEIDGALHLVALTYWLDMVRHNEMVISGDRVLRYPTIAFRLDERLVVDQIARSLALPVVAAA